MINVYAERRLPPEDVATFRSIEAKLRNVRVDDAISCHVVATAVQHRWPSLTLKHGRFMVSWDHSWLLTPRGNIVDVYPIAIVGGPLLIDGHAGPWVLFADAYTETKLKPEMDRLAVAVIIDQLSRA